VVALAIVGTLWVVWAGWSAGSRSVAWKLVTYQVLDDSSINVDFDVTMPPGTAAVCLVEARSSRHATVGIVEVEVAAATQPSQRVSTVVRTAEPAAAAVVRGCDPASGA
jgi:hypothetical protein